MKKFKSWSLLVTMLLGIASMLFGGAFAMAGTVGTVGAGEAAMEGGKGADLTGTNASATQVRDGDLAEPEVDDFIAKFRPYLFTADTDIRKRMKQVSVKGYEVDAYASGASLLDVDTTQAYTNSTGETTINLKSIIPAGTENIFAKSSTVLVHNENGQTDGEPILFIIEKGASGILAVCWNSTNGERIPDIPAGTRLSVLANACAESEMNVAPENYQPRPETIYLQKKICNIVMTDHFKEVVKKVPFFEQDLKDNALYNFRRKCSRTFWIGYPFKKKFAQNNDMGEEYIYGSKGMMRQVTMSYTTETNQISYYDLVAISKLQFTKYSVNNKAVAYCGRNFIENLLNIDFTKHKDITFSGETVMGINITKYRDSFGEIEFKHEPTLDDLGYEDHCYVFDIDNATRYVKDNERVIKVDMKEGAGDNREATRDVYIQADAVSTRGFNSIMVRLGEGSKTNTLVNASISLVTATSIPVANPQDGQLIFLVTDVEITDKNGVDKFTVPAKSIVGYVAETKTWSFYETGNAIGVYDGGWTLA